jgi:AcrR family transcriptional regulator
VSDTPTRVRPPQQQRSRASFERVLKAAQALLEENGYQAFTLAAVSKRAHVSIGSIYARVPSKDALFYAVHERVMEEIVEVHTKLAEPERWVDLSTRELIIEAVHEVAEPARTHQKFLRVVMHRGAVDEHVAEVGSIASSGQAELFKNLVLTRRDEIAHPDPELAVDVAYRMVYCTLARQVMYGPNFESQRKVDWDELVNELGVACLAYLLAPPRAA